MSFSVPGTMLATASGQLSRPVAIYPGHPSEDDFRKMYNDPRSLFSRDLPDMYRLPEGYEIK